MGGPRAGAGPKGRAVDRSLGGVVERRGHARTSAQTMAASDNTSSIRPPLRLTSTED
jgi:hypothetical protein